MSAIRGRRRGAARWRRTWIGTAAAAVAAVALSSCREHARNDLETAAIASDPAKHHPIAFSGRVEALYLEVAASGDGLSPNQEADVARFLHRYKAEGTGPLRIATPAGARGHLAVARTMRGVGQIVEEAGIPPEALATARGASTGHGLAVKLAYERAVAVPPACGAWPDDLGENRERLPYSDFGCASQRNLAVTVANARDLQHPQEETARSSERRSADWSKYVGGSASSEGGKNAPSGAAEAKPGAPGAKK
jgi:pilus assembly protein CpaD